MSYGSRLSHGSAADASPAGAPRTFLAAHKPRGSLRHEAHGSTGRGCLEAPCPGSALRQLTEQETLSAQEPEQIALLTDFSTGVELLDFNLFPAGKQAHLKSCHIVTQRGQLCKACDQGEATEHRHSEPGHRARTLGGTRCAHPSHLTSSKVLGFHVDQVRVGVHPRHSPGKRVGWGLMQAL